MIAYTLKMCPSRKMISNISMTGLSYGVERQFMKSVTIMINCAVDLYYILHCYYYIVYLHIDIYLSVTIKLWSVFTAVQVLTLVLFIKGFVLIILHIPLIIFFSVANLFRTNPQTIMIIFLINMTKKFIMCGM